MYKVFKFGKNFGLYKGQELIIKNDIQAIVQYLELDASESIPFCEFFRRYENSVSDFGVFGGYIQTKEIKGE